MSSNSNIVYGSFTQLFLVFAGHSMAGWAGLRTVVLFTRHLPAAAVGWIVKCPGYELIKTSSGTVMDQTLHTLEK